MALRAIERHEGAERGISRAAILEASGGFSPAHQGGVGPLHVTGTLIPALTDLGRGNTE